MISKKLKEKTKTRHTYFTRSNRSANFDKNRLEDIRQSRTKTPRRTRRTAAEKRAFTVYPLSSRPLSEMDREEQTVFSDDGAGAIIGDGRTDTRERVSEVLLGFTEEERRRNEAFSRFRNSLPPGTEPREPNRNRDERNIRQEIEQTVANAVRKSQDEMMSQLQESISQSLSAGFRQLALNTERQHMAELRQSQHGTRSESHNTRRNLGRDEEQYEQEPRVTYSSSPRGQPRQNYSMSRQPKNKPRRVGFCI